MEHAAISSSAWRDVTDVTDVTDECLEGGMEGGSAWRERVEVEHIAHGGREGLNGRNV